MTHYKMKSGPYHRFEFEVYEKEEGASSWNLLFGLKAPPEATQDEIISLAKLGLSKTREIFFEA